MTTVVAQEGRRVVDAACSIRSINVVEMQYPKYHDDDDEDDDDDDEDVVEEDGVKFKEYFSINCVPGRFIISLSPPQKGGSLCGSIFSRFT